MTPRTLLALAAVLLGAALAGLLVGSVALSLVVPVTPR